jgi:tRNA (uracil-5-)-methyltransferase TRM9
VKSDIACRLADLNRAFYQTFAAPFAATRRRVQPGAERLLRRIPTLASVADLGCGNGNAAVWLAEHGYRGRFTGLDVSPGLLDIARAASFPFPAEFRHADFLAAGWNRPLADGAFEFILAFAVVHHLPGDAARRDFLAVCRRLLAPGGNLFLSNWQFLRSEKLRRRRISWSDIGLSDSDVDEGDYLVDWRREGQGLRYVHVIGDGERQRLAAQTGFAETEMFRSDGEGGLLADYAVWALAPA